MSVRWGCAELTKYFQAAVADSICSVQAPVDTMEQQAEHCQMEKMQGGETNSRGGEERDGTAGCVYVFVGLGKKT